MIRMIRWLAIFPAVILASNLSGEWIPDLDAAEVPIRPVVTRGSVELNKAAIAEHKKIAVHIDAPLQQLVKMYDSYKKNGCVQGAGEDCAKMLQQIVRKYGEFMDTLSDKLPALQEKLERAADSYRGNLIRYRSETTVEKMWEDIRINGSESPKNKISRKVSRKKGMAGRLRMLLGLVRAFKVRSSSSGILGTARHYASLRDSVETIRVLNREVNQQKLELDIVSLTDAEFNKNYDRNVEKFEGLLGVIFGTEEVAEVEPAGSAPAPPSRPQNPTVNKWLKQRF
ncbi:MAG: hypothetical protein VCE91_17860 [Nitrospinota bacterium]